jgi:hypothetical protein
MTKRLFLTALLSLVLSAAVPAAAATFVIINGDSSGEGLNDPTPVTAVGGNTGTTLGDQRLILLQRVTDVWAAQIESPVDIKILARFNPMGGCSVLGSTGQGTAFMNFPGAPVADHWFHSAIADSITGADQGPGTADFYITYNSTIDTSTCALTSFYYGLDGAEGPSQIDLFPVVLHEMGHGLGFASFVNPTNGVELNGMPDIFGYYSLDMSSGLHWSDMTNGERVASAINTFNLVWDGPNATAAVGGTTFVGALDLEVTSPAVIAGDYDALRAGFGGSHPVEISDEFELVNAVSGTPSEGCDTLSGFTPGNIAVIDRGNCEFGVKALNAQNAGASAAVIANNQGGTVLVNMGGGAVGDQVTIGVVALGENDGNTIKAQLPGVNGRLGRGFPVLYAPNPVAPGSSVSHWDEATVPDLLMEPFLSADLFDEVDMTPALFKDVGHTVSGIFADGFESGGTAAWSSALP